MVRENCGAAEEEVVEEKPQQPEVETKPETEEVKPEKKPEINSSGAEKRIRQLVRQKKEREEQIDQLIAIFQPSQFFGKGAWRFVVGDEKTTGTVVLIKNL